MLLRHLIVRVLGTGYHQRSAEILTKVLCILRISQDAYEGDADEVIEIGSNGDVRIYKRGKLGEPAPSKHDLRAEERWRLVGKWYWMPFVIPYPTSQDLDIDRLGDQLIIKFEDKVLQYNVVRAGRLVK